MPNSIKVMLAAVALSPTASSQLLTCDHVKGAFQGAGCCHYTSSGTDPVSTEGCAAFDEVVSMTRPTQLLPQSELIDCAAATPNMNKYCVCGNVYPFLQGSHAPSEGDACYELFQWHMKYPTIKTGYESLRDNGEYAFPPWAVHNDILGPFDIFANTAVAFDLFPGTGAPLLARDRHYLIFTPRQKTDGFVELLFSVWQGTSVKPDYHSAEGGVVTLSRWFPNKVVKPTGITGAFEMEDMSASHGDHGLGTWCVEFQTRPYPFMAYGIESSVNATTMPTGGFPVLSGSHVLCAAATSRSQETKLVVIDAEKSVWMTHYPGFGSSPMSMSSGVSVLDQNSIDPFTKGMMGVGKTAVMAEASLKAMEHAIPFALRARQVTPSQWVDGFLGPKQPEAMPSEEPWVPASMGSGYCVHSTYGSLGAYCNADTMRPGYRQQLINQFISTPPYLPSYETLLNSFVGHQYEFPTELVAKIERVAHLILDADTLNQASEWSYMTAWKSFGGTALPHPTASRPNTGPLDAQGVGNSLSLFLPEGEDNQMPTDWYDRGYSKIVQAGDQKRHAMFFIGMNSFKSSKTTNGYSQYYPVVNARTYRNKTIVGTSDCTDICEPFTFEDTPGIHTAVFRIPMEGEVIVGGSADNIGVLQFGDDGEIVLGSYVMQSKQADTFGTPGNVALQPSRLASMYRGKSPGIFSPYERFLFDNSVAILSKKRNIPAVSLM
jgi:hypothetical protein